MTACKKINRFTQHHLITIVFSCDLLDFERAVCLLDEVSEVGPHEREREDSDVEHGVLKRYGADVAGDDALVDRDKVERVHGLRHGARDHGVAAAEVADDGARGQRLDVADEDVHRVRGPLGNLVAEAFVVGLEQLGVLAHQCNGLRRTKREYNIEMS